MEKDMQQQGFLTQQNSMEKLEGFQKDKVINMFYRN
jgi:hypothetical protein